MRAVGKTVRKKNQKGWDLRACEQQMARANLGLPGRSALTVLTVGEQGRQVPPPPGKESFKAVKLAQQSR